LLEKRPAGTVPAFSLPIQTSRRPTVPARRSHARSHAAPGRACAVSAQGLHHAPYEGDSCFAKGRASFVVGPRDDKHLSVERKAHRHSRWRGARNTCSATLSDPYLKRRDDGPEGPAFARPNFVCRWTLFPPSRGRATSCVQGRHNFPRPPCQENAASGRLKKTRTLGTKPVNF